MIRIGVIGINNLSGSSIEVLKGVEGFKVSGIYDSNWEAAKKMASINDIPLFYEVENLIESSDALIVTGASKYYNLIVESVRQAKHIFINDLFIPSLKESEQLIKLVHEAGVKVQLAHPFSENAAFRQSIPYLKTPFFVEMVNNHVLDEGIFRKDISQLMIYDISLLLCIVKSGVKRVYSNGFSINNENLDLISVRIEFANGSIANYVTKRIGKKEKHKYLIYQNNEIISINFKKHKSNIFLYKESLNNIPQKKNIFNFDLFNLSMDSIDKELLNFRQLINDEKIPLIELEDYHYSLQLTNEITERINRTRIQEGQY